MIDAKLTEARSERRSYLLDVIRCVKYLGRQGIALQGNKDEDNFTQLLSLLGTKDENIIKTMKGEGGFKYTHHDTQNEILDIMAAHVLRKKLSDIQERQFYSMMADEYTDVSNLEQLSFCVRTVDNDFEVKEDFLGFYELTNIKSETIVNAIKDILLRFNLNLDNCRGQTYDGASNMMGKHSGVATQILAEQAKAIATHCFGHSLSLAVKSLTSDCNILRCTMGTVGEICILVKYSPKREQLLGKLSENIEGEVKEISGSTPGKLDKLSVSRWTIRAGCFQKIINNYPLLLTLWDECLEEKLDTDTKARIVGCQKQMRSFSFFFGLQLGRKLYGMTDTLSKTLQLENMSAIDGKEQADLVIETLEGMREDELFLCFYETVKKEASEISGIGAPSLPRKRKNPNYSILIYLDGVKSTDESYAPATPYEHYKNIYTNALDAIINSIKDRFDQPGFQIFSNIEDLLLKAIKGVDYSSQKEALAETYKGDYDDFVLSSELNLLPCLFKD